MLQDELGLACQRHTEITGYTIGAPTHTNPTSTNNFAYLTGRNFGLASGSAHPGGSGETADTRAHRGGPRRRRDERCGRADQSALLGRRADRRVMAGYDGPLVDAFLHTPG